MKRLSIRSPHSIFVVVSCLAVFACQAVKNNAVPAESKQDAVQRGQYLVSILGCSDCHTPMKMGEHGPEPDMARFLSGHPQYAKVSPAPNFGKGPWAWAADTTNTAYAGRWGISYAANLTPDISTGLHVWTEDMFIKAIRTGKHMGEGRRIVSPMPWSDFALMTDDDLKAIFAYLQTVPAVSNQVPKYEVEAGRK